MTIDVKVPDIGDFKDIPVIEVLVKAGDAVKAEDPLVTLESDKATMDVPAPSAGVVKEVKIKAGDRVSEGSLVLMMEAASTEASAPSPQPAVSTSAASGRGSEPVPAPRALTPTRSFHFRRERERGRACASRRLPRLRSNPLRSPPRTHRHRCASSRASSAPTLRR